MAAIPGAMDELQLASGRTPSLPAWLRRWLWRGLALFAAWGLFSAVAWHVLGLQHEWLGQWGDSFAPVTGIVSTLALVFLAWSSEMQREQLGTQRDELGAQREQLRLQLEELRLTRDEMAAQREEMALQRRAQEESARQQGAANRIADLANAIAIEKGKLEAYNFVVASEGKVAVSVVRAVQRGTIAESSTTDAVQVANRFISELYALHQRLERASPTDEIHSS